MLFDFIVSIFAVASLVEAWIETSSFVPFRPLSMGRFPRGSVDWNKKFLDSDADIYVASLVEAWIETTRRAASRNKGWSLPSWKRGLKRPGIHPRAWSARRFPRGSVDWNYSQDGIEELAHVASLVEAWIETLKSIEPCMMPLSRFPRGSVDWNSMIRILQSGQYVASLVEAWIETYIIDMDDDIK